MSSCSRVGVAGFGGWRPALGMVALVASVLAAPVAAAEAARPQPTPTPGGCVRPVDNLVVTQSVRLCAGTYNLSDRGGDGVIQVKASGVTVDGTGVVLQGSGFRGYGVYLDGQPTLTDVTIKNFAGIAGYYYGMRLQNASRLSVVNNVVSNNYANKGRFLNINAGVDSAYGGGILVNNVSGSAFQTNRLTGQSSGLDLYNSSDNKIGDPSTELSQPCNPNLGNNASNNAVWGIKLYGSSDNVVRCNQAHDVNRTGDRGGDSAGVLLTHGSHRNQILDNNLTYSGDGFFIGNQYSAPSNDNLVARNDGSGSPNNCFEATFSAGNTFKGNVATNCNYGFWLGYSHDSTVQQNVVTGNRTDGINIDRGYNVQVSHNRLSTNGRNGVRLTGTGCSGWSPATQTCAATVANNHSLAGNSLLGAASYDVYNTGTMAAANDNWWGTTGVNASRVYILCPQTSCNVTVTSSLGGPAPETPA